MMSRALIGTAMAMAALLAPSPASPQAAGRRLTLADARAIIASAQTSATAQNLQVTVVVVDYRGDLIALERQPGANPASVDGAIGRRCWPRSSSGRRARSARRRIPAHRSRR
jgi:hypothetical protein